MNGELAETVFALAAFVLLSAGFCFAWLKFLEWGAGKLAGPISDTQNDLEEE